MKFLKIGLALAYIILPIDFFPEAVLGPIGFVDDGGALLYIIKELFTND